MAADTRVVDMVVAAVAGHMVVVDMVVAAVAGHILVHMVGGRVPLAAAVHRVVVQMGLVTPHTLVDLDHSSWIIPP